MDTGTQNQMSSEMMSKFFLYKTVWFFQILNFALLVINVSVKYVLLFLRQND